MEVEITNRKLPTNVEGSGFSREIRKEKIRKKYQID